jgi:hypothetical protein
MKGTPSKRDLQALAQLFSALEELHKHQYLHCDIRPQNVIFDSLRDDDSVPQLKLIDLGYALTFAEASHSPQWCGNYFYASDAALDQLLAETEEKRRLDAYPRTRLDDLQAAVKTVFAIVYHVTGIAAAAERDLSPALEKARLRAKKDDDAVEPDHTTRRTRVQAIKDFWKSRRTQSWLNTLFQIVDDAGPAPLPSAVAGETSVYEKLKRAFLDSFDAILSIFPQSLK